MFITKRHIPRRTILKGAGAALALPLLEAMVPARTLLAQTAAVPAKSRFVGIFFPHGMGPGHWVPKTEGALTEMPYTLESLKNVKDKTVVLSGLWSKSAEPPEGTTGSDHWVAAAFLTANKPRKTAGSDVDRLRADHRPADRAEDRPGQPDAVAAARLRRSELELEQLRRRLQLLVHELDLVGRPARTAPAGRQHPAHQPAADGAESAGRVRASVRKRRHAGAARAAPQPEPQHPGFGPRRAGRPQDRPSAHSDQRTVDQYTDEIREIERRLQIAAKVSNNVPEMALPSGIPEQFDDHIKLHFDLTALAFQADITRVMTMLGGRDLTGRAFTYPKSELFPDGGVSPSWHGASHHGDTADGIKRFADLNRYHVSTMARFAEKLKATPDGDGTLLDHSLILYGTNMGNSNQHQHYDVAHLLVGGANGKLKGGRHLAYDRKTVTTGNLLVSILDMYGIQQEKQGDSTGPLAKL